MKLYEVIAPILLALILTICTAIVIISSFLLTFYI
jgi:hypothetical protein